MHPIDKHNLGVIMKFRMFALKRLLSLSVIAVSISLFAGCLLDNKAVAKPQSRAMIYLLFPKNRNGALKRAMIVDGVELYGNAPFEYFEGNDARHIQRDEMTLKPPALEEELDMYISGLNAEISKWGENTDWNQVIFHKSSDQIHVRIKLKSGKIIGSFYTVKQDLVPEKCFVETVMYR